MKCDFGNGGFDLFGGVEHTGRQSLATKARALRIGRAVAERCEEKPMEMAACRLYGRLAALQQIFEQRLLVEIVDELECGMRCCASTMRQQRPLRGFASENSAAGVQIGDGIDEADDGLNFFQRPAIECGVDIDQPCPSHGFIAAHGGIQRAEETHEQHGQFERFRAVFERKRAALHPRHGGF